MSDERSEIVDLAYIGRALRRLTTEVATLRDEMKGQTAIILRHEAMLLRLDETLNEVLQQVTAMVAQNARIVDRVRAVEDRVDSFGIEPYLNSIELPLAQGGAEVRRQGRLARLPKNLVASHDCPRLQMRLSSR